MVQVQANSAMISGTAGANLGQNAALGRTPVGDVVTERRRGQLQEFIGSARCVTRYHEIIYIHAYYMCMCMSVCVYIYRYVDIYIYIFIYTHVYDII